MPVFRLNGYSKRSERLITLPESGRTLPEFPLRSYREVIVGSYRCIYCFEPETDRLYMVTVVHGSRMLIEEMLQTTD